MGTVFQAEPEKHILACLQKLCFTPGRKNKSDMFLRRIYFVKLGHVARMTLVLPHSLEQARCRIWVQLDCCAVIRNAFVLNCGPTLLDFPKLLTKTV